MTERSELRTVDQLVKIEDAIRVIEKQNIELQEVPDREDYDKGWDAGVMYAINYIKGFLDDPL